jgi:hypothetical protein
MTVLIAALITAVGAIVGAFVAALASRLEVRDRRSRLLKDLEISSKLDSDSDARQVLDAHIERSVQILVGQELAQDVDRRLDRGVYTFLLAALTGLLLSYAIITTPPEPGRVHGFFEVTYVLLALFLIAATVIATYDFVRATRKRRALISEYTDD